jgi:hypothetical protein
MPIHAARCNVGGSQWEFATVRAPSLANSSTMPDHKPFDANDDYHSSSARRRPRLCLAPALRHSSSMWFAISAIAANVFPQDSARDIIKRAVASRSFGSIGQNGQGQKPNSERRLLPFDAVLRLRFFAIETSPSGYFGEALPHSCDILPMA